MLDIRSSALNKISALALLLLTNWAYAGNTTCDSIASGNWSDASTWSCNTGSGIPVSDTNVNILNTHTVLLDIDASVTRVIVNPGGDLDVAASPGGLALSWISNSSDISAANIDLFGDFTINALTGSPIDLILGAVDGPFDLNLNAEGNTLINGPLGAITPLNGFDTDQDGTITIAHTITTNFSQFIDDDAVIISGDVTLSGLGINIRGTVDADVLASDRNLAIISTGGSQFINTVGGITPLNSLVVDASFMTLEADVSTTETQTYIAATRIRSAVNLTGTIVNFNGELNSESVTANGFDLTVTGDANFTSDLGTLTPAAFGVINLNSITVSGNVDFNVSGDGADIITDGDQAFNSTLTAQTDIKLSSRNSGDITFRDDIFAIGQHLTINTAGTTMFTDNVFGAPVNVEAASITTDAAGVTRVTFNADFQLTSDDTPTTFNDELRLGPSTRFTLNQNGAADTVFNDDVIQISGGSKLLTVNDVSGQTIFNGSVNLGELITNDGSGDDSTVINTPTMTINQAVSNSGIMTFNDPVELMQDVTFTENNSGQIIFNNTLDEADGAGSVDVVINSDNEVVLGPVGTVRSINSITTDAGGSTTLNGDVLGNTPFNFNDAVTLGQNSRVSAEDVAFNGAVNLQTFDLTVSALDASMDGVISGSGNLISQVFSELRLTNENTYTGETRITEGNLSFIGAISNNHIINSSAIILENGTTLTPNNFTFTYNLPNGQTLSGEGTVNDFFVADSGSIVSPGSSPGILNFASLSMATGSTYQVEIEGLTPGSGHDQLVANSVQLDAFLPGGATLELTLNSNITLNDELVVIDNLGVSPVIGTFNGLSEGSMVTASNGTTFTISYVGGDGNDVVLTGTCSSAITVTNGADSGAGSFREAVSDICPGGTIDFSGNTSVTLNSEILIDKTINIDGTGFNVVFSGNSANRVFYVGATGELNLQSVFVVLGFSANEGGAIFNEGALSVIESTFEANSSASNDLAGGAIFNASTGSLDIESSTFLSNTGIRGGAIFNSQNGADEGAVVIRNSTFASNGNNALEGGAINNRGVMISTNNTFANNGGAGTNGGGVFTWDGDTTLINTIIADSPSGSDCFIANNSVESNSNSLIEGGNCDAALTDDPQLLALDLYGGNTLTIGLSLQSPAVDAGSDALCTTEDQRGLPRPQLESCDIGAYETEFLGIIHVNQNPTPALSGTCLPGACWSNAYTNLQDAIAVAGPTSEIWVAEGVYLPDVGQNQTDDDQNSSFVLPESVLLFGGFDGSETVREQRDFINNVTILSGDIDENDVNLDGNNTAETVADIMGQNAFNILETTGDSVVLDGFTITAGFANDKPTNSRRGGGINCSGTQSTNNVFANNLWIANWADNRGGASYSCHGTFLTSQFVANQSGDNGGAVYAGFAANLEQVSFIGNAASGQAGALYAGMLNIDRGYFAANQAGTSAGAVYSFIESTITNTLFRGNAAVSNGGALELGGQNELVNVTLTGNVAGQSGAAIYSQNGPIRQGGDGIDLSNSIIWNNQDNSGTGTIGAGITSDIIPSVTNSLFQGSGGSTNWNGAAGTDGGNNIDLDPEFVLDVILFDVPTVFGNARLTPGSVAIGSGNNNLVTTPFDLDGNGRINGGTVDMGAYEYSDLIFKDGFDQNSGK